MAQRRVHIIVGNDQRSNKSRNVEIQNTSALENSKGRGPNSHIQHRAEKDRSILTIVGHRYNLCLFLTN
jgi:hypothetical protein